MFPILDKIMLDHNALIFNLVASWIVFRFTVSCTRLLGHIEEDNSYSHQGNVQLKYFILCFLICPYVAIEGPCDYDPQHAQENKWDSYSGHACGCV